MKKIVVKKAPPPKKVVLKVKRERPEVDMVTYGGPKAIGKPLKSGKQLVTRFYVSKYHGTPPSWLNVDGRGIERWRKGKGPHALYESGWFVMDASTGEIAKGTEREGYSSVEDASAVCGAYRKKYGQFVKERF